MRVTTAIIAALYVVLAVGAAVPAASINDTVAALRKREPPPTIASTHNAVSPDDMEAAFQCLADYCQAKGGLSPRSKIRCVRGSAIVFVCNYGNWNPCDGNEMRKAQEFIREDSGRVDNTGWVYYKDWAKTYGFDAWCPRGECNLGFTERDGRHQGEACPNTKEHTWEWSSIQARVEKEPEPEAPEPTTTTWQPLPTEGPPIVTEIPTTPSQDGPRYGPDQEKQN